MAIKSTWKQCVWKSGDSKDKGLIQVCFSCYSSVADNQLDTIWSGGVCTIFAALVATLLCRIERIKLLYWFITGSSRKTVCESVGY